MHPQSESSDRNEAMQHSRWIGMAVQPRCGAAPLLRREFHLETDPTSATLTISGLGFFEAWINGRRVRDHVLDPAQTDYELRVFYLSHDVTGLVQKGANALGVILGNGWFNQDRVWGPHGLAYGEPRLLVELNIRLADGRHAVIISDQSWSCAPGPITENNIYAGETYDARLERPGWTQAAFDDSTWRPAILMPSPGGRLQRQIIPPIRRIEEIQPRSIRKANDTRHVVDMGRNFSGWARIKLHAPAGTRIQMRFAEALAADGNIDTASTGVFATGVEQIDVYIAKGEGLEVWEPRFTCHGFRYLELTGWPGEPAPEAVTGIVVHTDLPPVGLFESSDERLNRLHSIALWTHRSNLHGIPEDCPARERCGWLGDANVVAEFSMWNFDGREFWAKYLDDIETTRALNGGLPCNIAPGKRTCGTANPDWAAAFILLPWYGYVHYRDSTFLTRHWEGMQTLIEHFHDSACDWILEGGFGDWFDPGGESCCSHTPPTLTTTVWFHECVRVMADAAAALKQPALSERYASWLPHILAAFQARFYQRDTGTFGSQTADVLALHFALAPETEEDRVTQSLVEDIRRRDTHLNTGIMGLRYLFEVLTRRGHGKLALALMHQDSYPSFGDLIHRGATTLWEYWGEPQLDREHGARSLNHPMMGGYDNWFYNTLAGIRPDPAQPGFKHFFLQPHPVDGLDWVRAHHDCAFGRIASEWKLSEGSFDWKILVPPGTRATACLPYTQQIRGFEPGEYRIFDKRPD